MVSKEKPGYNVMNQEIKKYLSEDKRLDGRKPFEVRGAEVTLNISQHAEGSVRVKMGKTEVLAGIKMGCGTPYPDHENEGTMMTGMELLPMSCPEFDYGPPTIRAIETSRVIDRGIRESGFIDFHGLCIEKGEKVWNIFIDLVAINNDGNLLDAGSLAAIIALRIARMPVLDENGNIKHGEFSDKGLPLVTDKMPITTTVYKIGDKMCIDPTFDEEKASEGRLTIEVSEPKAYKEPMINAMQKGGEAPLSIEEVDVAIKEATKMFKSLNSLVEPEVKKAK